MMKDPPPTTPSHSAPAPLNISMVSAATFKKSAKHGRVGIMSVCEIDIYLGLSATDKYEYLRKNEHKAQPIDLKAIVPKEYHNMLNMFHN